MKLFFATGLLALAAFCDARRIFAQSLTKDASAVLEARQVPAPPPLEAPIPLFERCKCKGEVMLQAMRSSDAEAAKFFDPKRTFIQSPYKDYPTDLNKWGWQDVPVDRIRPYYFELDYAWGIANVLRDLGVSDKSTEDGGNNEVVTVQHNRPERDAGSIDKQTYTVDGKEYRATGASFSFSVNAIDGVIIAMDRISPRFSAKKRIPKIPDDQLPQLNQWSDVGWLYYLDRVNKMRVPLRRVKYFLSLMITNGESLMVIGEALDGKPIKPWPGATFLPDSDGYKAILGTANGIGIGYFLIQHKDREQLGNMYVSQIQAFSCKVKDDFCLLFKILPVEPANPKPPVPSPALQDITKPES
ncbi:hypothetical protein P280DRAFT_394996 [Massarina eburnea CBS 473.64]|uniref:Uncharacterized protein n=1 Tax=Massarina eburnea CBS 473.64 TaxID=1395130 RepID=A0A6A6SB83_9PLEO|nr:hypothetical protein P280DRAFT_394996 [Massarina eburnea CBS 473.64]